MARPARLTTSLPVIWRLIVRLRPQIRRQRTIILGAFAALFLEVAFRLLEPWPLKFVFDRILPTEAVDPSVAEADPLWLLLAVGVAIVIFAGMRALGAYLSTVGFALAGNRVLTDARSIMFDHLQRLSLSWHARARSGDLLTRVVSDVGRLQEVTVTALLPLLANTLLLAGMLIVMAFVNWQLALTAFLVIPGFAFVTRRLGRRIHQSARKQREREGRMGSAAAEAINSMKTVQALSLEALNNSTFVRENASSLKEGVQTKRLSARLERSVDVLIAIGTALVVVQGAFFVMRGELTAGDLVVFLAYLKGAFKPMRDVAKYAARISKGAASGERVLDILDATPDIVDRPDAVEAPEHITSLSFDDVTFSYEPGTPAVAGVRFDTGPGKIVALVGPSGAGKTTILNLMLRLYDPDSGAVRMNGRDIREFTVASVRQRFAIVPQESILFAISIRDNIACAWPEATEAEIVRAATLAQAHDFIERLPEGYDTVIGERGDTLSGGQRQRIALARALVRPGRILIFDEPTASLDQENATAIRELLHRLSEDRIVFVISHDDTMASVADTVIELADGRVDAIVRSDGSAMEEAFHAAT